MCYILYMNKDVIYIEPEDDITDIISKIEGSKQKIIALVPPKKAGVFRSVVNIKLIAKAGVTAGKNVVIVTGDSSITKLAGAAKLPVAKNLQSAPTIPDVEAVAEEVVEEAVAETEEKPTEKEATEEEKPETEEAEEDDEEGEEEEALPKKKEPKKKSASKLTGNKILDWIKTHKKLSIIIGVGGLLLILILIWALVIAPAAELQVSIKTDANNFSKTISFTTNLGDENIEEGKFYLEEKKIESSQEVDFEATGEKNVGEKASGEVTVYAYFPLNIKASTVINEGDSFTISGLTYKSTASEVLAYSGKQNDYSECDNKDNKDGLLEFGCRITGHVPIVATEPGEKYNMAPSSTGWTTTAKVFVSSEKNISGGTNDIIKIVQQSDIDKAKGELASTNESENKEKLYETINDSSLKIESSFKQDAGKVESTPAVGEEVKEGVKPKIKATTTTSIYVLDKTKVEEFIKKGVELDESQKIYEIRNPFVESFMDTSDGYTGRLKAVYYTGPKITENDVIEKVKGKGLGEAQHDLRDINGVAEVHIEKSFPWVLHIPNDPNKITVVFEIKDQNGNKIEAKEESEEENKDGENSDNKESEEKTEEKKEK